MSIKFFANLLILTLFLAPLFTHSRSPEEDAAIEQFAVKYNNQDYEAAKVIVDKFYHRHDATWSMYAAALHMKNGKCSDALKAIEYVLSYYDVHQDELVELSKDKESSLFRVYLDLKKVGVNCNWKLGNWVGFVNDATAYLELSEDSDVEFLFIALGNAHRQIAMENVSSAVRNYSKAVLDFNDVDQESARFHLTHLYFIEGQIEKSINSAEGLFKMAKKKEKWVEEMKKIPGLNELVLESVRVKSILQGE